VSFVGAGPGSPDLLTLRAVARLREADVVVHDRLVPMELLAAAVSARLLPAPRGGEAVGDDDPGAVTGRLLVRLAHEGARVVRLKGGDPGVFARLVEELQPVRDAGIDWEIVPGVTAALAAAAAAGLPLTNRAAASSLTFITGHGRRADPSRVDYALLARLPGTLAVYMGLDQARTWAGALLAAGRPPSTPVTVVSRVGWPDQHVDSSDLAGCAAGILDERCAPPAIVLVAMTAEPAPPGPLAGQTILVTRPAGQSGDLVQALAEQGGTAIALPLVTIGPPPDPAAFDTALRRADGYDWIVFVSTNAVAAFRDRLRALGCDGRSLGTARIAAIGSATRAALEDAGWRCDLQPDDERSEGLLATLAGSVRGGRFLLLRADAGRDVLREGLRRAGHHVDEVAAYRAVPLEALPPGIAAGIDPHGIDWVTVTSGRIAEAACRLLGPQLRRCRVASISPVTSAVLRGHGIEPAAEADRPTTASLVGAIVTAVRNGTGHDG